MHPPPEHNGVGVAGARGGLSQVLPDLLTVLARTTEQKSPVHDDLEALVNDACRHESTSDDTAWVRVMVRAGQGMGLALSTLPRSPQEVVSKGRQQGPIATLAHGPDGPRWVLVDGWGVGQVRVRVGPSASKSEEQWVNAASLATLLGMADTRQVLPWVLAEQARPLHAFGGGEGGGPVSPLIRLKALMRLEGSDLWAVVVYAMGVGLFALTTPIAVQALVNTMAFGALLQPVLVLSVLLLGGLLFGAGLRAVKVWVVEHIQQRLFIHVVSDLGNRLPRVHARALERAHGPELVNRFFDIATLQKSVASLLLDGLSAVLQASIGMLLMAFYHPLLLAFDVLLLAALVAIILGYSRAATETSLYASKAKYAVGAWLQELVRHPLTFRREEGLSFALRRTDTLARKWLEARRKHYKYLFRQIVGALGLQAVASALLLLLGGWLVIQRQLTLGQLVAAELIVSAVLVAVAKFGKHLGSYYDLLAALDKLGQLVDLPLEDDSGESQPPGGGPARLELREVTFGYEGGARVLEGASLELEPGARAALLSAGTSAGRSTLADLLYRLHRPSSGRILLDGVDLRDLKPDTLRREVAVIKGPELFSGSLVDNVRLGRTEVSLGEVRRVLEKVGLHEAVTRLPEGLDTQLVTGGAPLTSCQAVLLTLARVLLKPPRLLVLDGTLDALDGAPLERVLQVLLEREAPWTLLLLTRREDIQRRCETHCTLVGGRIQEASSHPLRVLM
jgi:putative ABC transport system ATP-binding protein